MIRVSVCLPARSCKQGCHRKSIWRPNVLLFEIFLVLLILLDLGWRGALSYHSLREVTVCRSGADAKHSIRC